MDEYIKREEAIKATCVGCFLNSNDENCNCAEKQEILNVPSVDVVEVRHGKWLDKPMEWYCDGEEPFVIGMVDGAPYASCYCSECGEWLVASDEYPVKGNYCPNCGAKMDGGNE